MTAATGRPTSSTTLIEQTDPPDADGVRRKTYIEYETTASGVSRRDVVRVCGDTTTCGTGSEVRTEYEYWGDTLLPSVERRIDGTTSETLETHYSYDNAGRLLSEDGPLPGTDDATYYRYDALGRRTWEIGPLGDNGLRNAKKITYRPSDDKVLKVEVGTVPLPSSPTLTTQTETQTSYDSRRNPTHETISAGGSTQSVVQRSFDSSNRLTCEARRMNPGAFGSLPGSACTLGSAGSFGGDRITRNVYDAAGQLLQVQRAYGTALQQNYATYTYSPNGQRASVTDANGNKAALRYDGHDRQNRWVFPSKTTPGAVNEADYEAYGYDAAGNRTSLRKRDGGTLTYQYDGLNRVSVKTVPATASGTPGYSVHYRYDMLGLQTRARFGSASGTGITNAYDAFGRLVSSTTTMGGVSRTLASEYDAGGRRTRLTFPDNHYFSYEYDPAGRLTTIRENGATAVASFGYDHLGRRANASFSETSTSYGYDDLSRLSSLDHDLSGTSADQSLTFGYNPVSQITTRTRSNPAYASTTIANSSKSYGVNGLNQYTSVGGSTHGYDQNGNLNSDGATTFRYDAENRLVAATGAKTANLVYDPLGRLFETSGGSAGTTQFLYDGDRLVAEYDGSGNLERRYVHGSGVDEPVLWYEGAGLGSPQGLITNHQGSIVAVADAGGNSLAINGYDAWGVPNANNLGRFQYTGQAWLPELGLYHYKARVYSPILGRFLQTDPVGYEDQINLYAYVGNDPLNNIDPTGLQCTGSRIENSDGTCASTGGFNTGTSGLAQGMASRGGDAFGNPELDRAASVGLAILADERVEQAFEIQHADGGGYYFSDPRKGPNDHEVSVFVSPDTAAVAHTHVRSATNNRRETRDRELHGPGDHVVVERHSVPNYISTPSGAIRVLEQVNGIYRIRTVQGSDARGQSKWKPGTCDSRGRCRF